MTVQTQLQGRPTAAFSQSRLTAPLVRPCLAVARNGTHQMALPTACKASTQDDLGLGDGWGIEVSPASGGKAEAATKAKVATKGSKAPSKPQKVAKAPEKPGSSAPQPRQRSRSPFMDITSEEGMLGLTLLQQKLKRAEAAGEGSLTTADQQDLMRLHPAAAGRKAPSGKSAAVQKVPPRKQKVVYEDDDGNTWEEPEDEDVTDKPSFELSVLDDQMEYVTYDKEGNVESRVAAGAVGDAGADGGDDDDDLLFDGDDDDEFDFGSDSGWGQLSSASNAVAAAVEAAEAAGSPVKPSKEQRLLADAARKQQAEQARKAGGRSLRTLGESEPPGDVLDVERALSGSSGSGRMVADGDEDEWGLDELAPALGYKGADGRAGRPTLMQELGVSRGEGSKPRGVDEDLGVTVTWGGSAGTSSTDLEEQERLLSRMFKPHKVKKLMQHQRQALAEQEALLRGASSRMGTEAKTHKQLRIVQGSAANKRLISSQGAQTRPMMEKVRMAIFNMVQSQAGSVSSLPTTARWLDIFAGTGSVGLEALSRGVRECHFVEMDPWVTRNILGKNITACGFSKQSIVHTNKAEEFLRKAVSVPRFAGGAFDFISMCPPYLLVSYPELFDLLERSQLMHGRTILFVEYPKQLSHQVPDKIQQLVKVRDRKYGRTWIAVYGPSDEPVRGSDDY